VPVDDVRIAGRNTQGVRIFKTEEGEKVVSVERVPEDGTSNGGEPDNGGENGS
jgi:DNA gyrase subunit A